MHTMVGFFAFQIKSLTSYVPEVYVRPFSLLFFNSPRRYRITSEIGLNQVPPMRIRTRAPRRSHIVSDESILWKHYLDLHHPQLVKLNGERFYPPLY